MTKASYEICLNLKLYQTLFLKRGGGGGGGTKLLVTQKLVGPQAGTETHEIFFTIQQVRILKQPTGKQA